MSRWQRILLIAAGLGFVGIFLAVVSLRYVAYRYAEVIDEPHLLRAVRLDPLNADYHARLGHWFLFADDDPRQAAAEYEAATRLNPQDARYWLDLATARLQLSDAKGQLEAIHNAAAAAPTTPDIAAQAGMQLLVGGRDGDALQTFRKLLESAPEQTDTVVAVCWRGLHDSQRVLNEALPRTAAAYLTFQRYLTSVGADDDADRVWNATLALNQPIPTSAALSYIDTLLRRENVEAAASTWSYLLEREPALRRYREDENLITNPAFDQPFLNDAFDWRFPAGTPVDFSVDSNQGHRGSTSLLLAFNGDMVSDTGLYQLVPVAPNTEYSLHATVKAEELVSAAPLRFQASDAFTNESLGATNGVVGTTGDWVQVAGTIRSGPKSHLLRIGITHEAQSHIAGKLWIDEVVLKKGEAHGSSR